MERRVPPPPCGMRFNSWQDCKTVYLFLNTDKHSLLLQGSHRSWKTWKVMEFKHFIFQAWKVREFNSRSLKLMEN